MCLDRVRTKEKFDFSTLESRPAALFCHTYLPLTPLARGTLTLCGYSPSSCPLHVGLASKKKQNCVQSVQKESQTKEKEVLDRQTQRLRLATKHAGLDENAETKLQTGDVRD